MNEAPNPDAARLAAEDVGRANLYALIGRLFYGPPDATLCTEICRSGREEADQDAGRLAAGWRALQKACGSVSAAPVRQEYDDLFVGVGRAPVTPYLSGYVEPASPDRYLVRLRDQLSEWGFLRRSNVFEVEDHVSALCDVMRFLVEESRPLEEQQRFFASFVYPGVIAFLAALQQAASADFYKTVAAFALAFFEVEKAGLEMIDSD